MHFGATLAHRSNVWGEDRCRAQGINNGVCASLGSPIWTAISYACSIRFLRQEQAQARFVSTFLEIGVQEITPAWSRCGKLRPPDATRREDRAGAGTDSLGPRSLLPIPIANSPFH